MLAHITDRMGRAESACHITLVPTSINSIGVHSEVSGSTIAIEFYRARGSWVM